MQAILDIGHDAYRWALDLLADHSLFGIPYARYALAAMALALLWRILAWALRLAGLYFLAGLTPKGRIATVRSNVDGDTVKVTDRHDPKKSAPVRLIGVDTPESLPSLYMDVAPFGKEAAEYTRRRLRPGQRVLLIYDVQPYDKFGRELVYLYTAWGELYNATLIRRGYAFAVEYKPNLRFARRFKRLEEKAKRREKRLWEVYDERGQLDKSYKKSKAYRRFKYQHENYKSKKDQ